MFPPYANACFVVKGFHMDKNLPMKEIPRTNGVYSLDFKQPIGMNAEDGVDSMTLHRRMAHFPCKVLSKTPGLTHLKFENVECLDCDVSKRVRRPHIRLNREPAELGSVWSLDTAGPFSKPTRNGSKHLGAGIEDAGGLIVVSFA